MTGNAIHNVKGDEIFKIIFDTCPDAIFLVDLNLNVLMANPYAVHLMGFEKEEELIGRNMMGFIPESDRQRALGDKEAVKSRGTAGIIHYNFYRKDGSTIECQISDTLITDGNGEPVAIMGVVRDISDIRKIELDLYESEERFRNLFESSLDGVAFTDLDGRFILANDAYQRLTGYGIDELRAMTFRDITPERWHDFESGIVRDQVLARGYTDEYEKEYIRKDGSQVPVSIRAWVVRDKNGNPSRMWGIVRDIAEYKKSEQKIRDLQNEKEILMNELLLAEENERRKLALDLHDNLNQSLALVKVKLGGIRDHPGCEGMQNEVDDVIELMDQAIDFTRSLTDKISPPILHQLGPAAAIHWLAERMQEQYPIRIESNIDPGVSRINIETGAMIFRMIRELLVNVIKHSRAKNAEITVELTETRIRITVRDDGIGFDITELAVSNASALGLIGMRERLYYIGGAMDVISRPGTGTRVVLSVPLGGPGLR